MGPSFEGGSIATAYFWVVTWTVLLGAIMAASTWLDPKPPS